MYNFVVWHITALSHTRRSCIVYHGISTQEEERDGLTMADQEQVWAWQTSSHRERHTRRLSQ